MKNRQQQCAICGNQDLSETSHQIFDVTMTLLERMHRRTTVMTHQTEVTFQTCFHRKFIASVSNVSVRVCCEPMSRQPSFCLDKTFAHNSDQRGFGHGAKLTPCLFVSHDSFSDLLRSCQEGVGVVSVHCSLPPVSLTSVSHTLLVCSFFLHHVSSQRRSSFRDFDNVFEYDKSN